MQNYVNPMTGFYRNQMNNIAGGYNYTPTYQNMQPMPSQTPINQFPCRSVSNIKEVEALILDNPTVPHIFTNFPNNEIYVKYIDNTTGSAKVVPFIPKPQEETEKKHNFSDEKIKQKFDYIEESLKMLDNEVLKLKGVLPNDEHVTNDKDVSKSNGRNAKNV